MSLVNVNADELCEALDDAVEELDTKSPGKRVVVVIKTDRQLLPNAEYIFEMNVDEEASKIILRPTMRHIES